MGQVPSRSAGQFPSRSVCVWALCWFYGSGSFTFCGSGSVMFGVCLGSALVPCSSRHVHGRNIKLPPGALRGPWAAVFPAGGSLRGAVIGWPIWSRDCLCHLTPDSVLSFSARETGTSPHLSLSISFSSLFWDWNSLTLSIQFNMPYWNEMHAVNIANALHKRAHKNTSIVNRRENNSYCTIRLNYTKLILIL